MRLHNKKLPYAWLPLLAVALAVLLSGCATMSKQECQQADWYLKGLDDATQGYALERVVEHGKACARVNITPDMKEYREGHAKGARLYCVPEKGYSEGRNGAAYNGICSADLEARFLRAYRDGQQLFYIQRNIDNASSALNNMQAQMDSDYQQIAQLKNDVVYSSDGDERRYKMHRIDELENDIRRLEYEFDRTARELEKFKYDYRIVEDQHQRMGYLR